MKHRDKRETLFPPSSDGLSWWTYRAWVGRLVEIKRPTDHQPRHAFKETRTDG